MAPTGGTPSPMPRSPRLGALGTLHPLLVRDLAGQVILRDDADRDRCVARVVRRQASARHVGRRVSGPIPNLWRNSYRARSSAHGAAGPEAWVGELPPTCSTWRWVPLYLPHYESVATLLQRLTGVDLTRCPVCRQGRLRAGRTPGPRAGQLMSPRSAVRRSIAPTPRCARRDGGLCPSWVSRVPPEGLIAPASPLPTSAPLRRPPGLRSQIPSPGPSVRIQSP